MTRYHHLLTVLAVAIVVMAMSLAPTAQLQSRDGIGRIGEAARGLASTAEQASRSGPVPSSEGAADTGPSGGSLDSPVQLDDGGLLPAAVMGGLATWYCGAGSPCTHGYGPADLVAAIDPSLGIERGERITISFDGKSVAVVVVDVCQCMGRRLVDLTSGAFRRLAPLSAGVIPVSIEFGGPAVTLPPTSTDVTP